MTQKTKLGAAAQAKQQPSAMEYSANNQINYLIKNLAKGFNPAYRAAIARSKQSPIDELQRRVERKVRRHYSADRFKDLQTQISSLPPLQRHDFLRELEQRTDAKTRRS